MPATAQLRIYTINRGQMEAFVKVWEENVRPLRLKVGFKIDGAWVLNDVNKFVWIVSYDGPEDWASKEQAYYNAPERKAMTPDPIQFIAHIETHMMTPVS